MSDCHDLSENNTFDLAVIGAGSAGFSAAITAAEAGARVALIGDGTIGGTCVNVGCVPSKTLIRTAESLHHAAAAKRFDGIETSARVTDWQAVVRQKQALVDELRQARYTDLLPRYDSVTYMEGKASFTDTGLLEVDGEIINAAKVIIATGSQPDVPAITGMEQVPYLTSTTALELEHLPASLLVIGAGYIGVEIAQMFSRAGVEVKLVSRRGLLPKMEPEIGKTLTRYLREEGVHIVTVDAYTGMDVIDGGVRLQAQLNQKELILIAEKVLVATGRKPNTDSLNLSAAGIEMLIDNGVKVDDHMQTSRPGVYAAGDVTGADQFVYMAAYGAKLAARNAMNCNSLSYDNAAMPAVVFTDPQVASVGLTEAGAKAAGYEIRTSTLTLSNVPRALAARDTRGLIKLVADRESGRLLGAHILAPEGADSIQTAAVAIKMGMTYQQLSEMIFPYLTTVEGLKLAAQTFDRDVKNLSCCAG
ncbi:mercury(II) reductase [Granulosicoccus sp. 3-233]|uniref:mercury(II) reductase n=1 Tax=Granulosicoccus sp. 3-233 TaxID=3417969 RepID=UPI003D33B18E